jgi:hypothetical protein
MVVDKPITVTSSQFDHILSVAQPLAAGQREAYAVDVATSLQGQPIGDGSVGRAVREAFATRFIPPSSPRRRPIGRARTRARVSFAMVRRSRRIAGQADVHSRAGSANGLLGGLPNYSRVGRHWHCTSWAFVVSRPTVPGCASAGHATVDCTKSSSRCLLATRSC